MVTPRLLQFVIKFKYLNEDTHSYLQPVIIGGSGFKFKTQSRKLMVFKLKLEGKDGLSRSVRALNPGGRLGFRGSSGVLYWGKALLGLG